MKLVGEILKEQRLRKNLSLNKISKELNISEDILEKFEIDETDKNISSVYVLGHLRSYVSYLDLDSKYILNKFKEQNDYNETEDLNQIPKPYIINSPNYFLKILPFFSIFIIIFSFYFLFVDNEKSKREYALLPDLPENYEAVVEKTDFEIGKKQIKNDLSVSSAVASIDKEDNINVNEAGIITLKMLNPTWIQLRDLNDKIILSKLMIKNEEFSYNIDLNYSITAGNAGNILVLINNNVRGKIGASGEVVDSLIIDNSFDN